MRIGLAQVAQVESCLDKPKNAAEVHAFMGHVVLFCIGRHHNQRHPKTVFVGVVDGRGDVVMKPSSIIPSNKDSGIRPVWVLPIALTMAATHEGPEPSFPGWSDVRPDGITQLTDDNSSFAISFRTCVF